VFERFSPQARRVVERANDEARRLGQKIIGPEHILLGLTLVESSAAAYVLRQLDVDLATIRRDVETTLPRSPETVVVQGKLPQTPGAMKVIEYALEEARGLDHKYVGTEHLLLGLLREAQGIGAQVLFGRGLTADDVREKVIELNDLRREWGLMSKGDAWGGGEGKKSGRRSMARRLVGNVLKPLRTAKSPLDLQQPAGGRKYTDRVGKAMTLAHEEAKRLNHEYIGTEHILLGLAREGAGVAATVLKQLQVDLDQLRAEVEKVVRPGPPMVTTGSLPLTPRAKQVLESAAEEARGFNHNYVGTEHLLLGLLHVPEGVAAQVLISMGLTMEAIRGKVLLLLGPQPKPGESPPRSE